MSRRRYSRRGRTRAQELNITPLIDMVFILLIFFLVTTSFVKESGVTVERPVARTAGLIWETGVNPVRSRRCNR